MWRHWTTAIRSRCGRSAELSSGYGFVTFLAGILILLLAPVLGQRADATGRKKGALFLFTMLLALLQFGLFFVRPEPGFFWLGAAFLALGAVVSEIAASTTTRCCTRCRPGGRSARSRASAGASATSAASSRS
jgi:MFS-type transporter involved in bile tolerance (Atg22 family)